MIDWFMFRVVARVAILLGLNLNRVFFPRLAKQRGEPWTMKGLREKMLAESGKRAKEGTDG